LIMSDHFNYAEIIDAVTSQNKNRIKHGHTFLSVS
jgi:hypothetical protein